METRTRLSRAELADVLSGVFAYNGMKTTDVQFLLDGAPVDVVAEVVCEAPGLVMRVEPEDHRDPLVRQMEQVIAMTPQVKQ